MTIQTAADKDGEVKDLLVMIYRHPAFDRLRVAFVSHSPKGTDTEPTSIEVAHGQYLGTRYVFNTIEDIVTKPPTQTRPKRESGGRDPDLA